MSSADHSWLKNGLFGILSHMPLKIQIVCRHLTISFCATLAVAFLSFLPARFALAATLDIVMGNTALTSGTTSSVNFNFSAVPAGFDDSDVDLSNANGTMSPVTVTADPRRYTATYMPNEGVNDDTNTIVVGTAWVDSGGLPPSGPSTSPNFTVHTSSSSSGACPAPSVRINVPNGGETFNAGDIVDVFWTVSGCGGQALELMLSADGGETFTEPVMTSTNPASGYYRWTVPDLDATAAKLRGQLFGQGASILAEDVTDGTFTVKPAPPPLAGGAPPPPNSPPNLPPTSPPPAELLAPTQPPSNALSPASTPQITPPREPPPSSSVKSPSFLAPMAPPMSNVPTPQLEAPPDQSPQPMPTNTHENQTVTLDSVQGAVETSSVFSGSPMVMGWSFVTGALLMLALLLGARKVMSDRKLKSPFRCNRCLGTGKDPKPVALGACATCIGTGMVEEEGEEQAMECKHCKGEGEDPCHVCKGTGKVASGMECTACKGGGKTLVNAKDPESDEAKNCELCDGEGEVSAAIKKQVQCDTCGGTGKD